MDKLKVREERKLSRKRIREIRKKWELLQVMLPVLESSKSYFWDAEIKIELDRKDGVNRLVITPKLAAYERII